MSVNAHSAASEKAHSHAKEILEKEEAAKRGAVKPKKTLLGRLFGRKG